MCVLGRVAEKLGTHTCGQCLCVGTDAPPIEPLPPKRPWTLSYSEQQERKEGLQRVLTRVLEIDSLVESEVLKQFCSKDAVDMRRLQSARDY